VRGKNEYVFAANNPFTGDPEALAKGKDLFRWVSYVQVCHCPPHVHRHMCTWRSQSAVAAVTNGSCRLTVVSSDCRPRMSLCKQWCCAGTASSLSQPSGKPFLSCSIMCSCFSCCAPALPCRRGVLSEAALALEAAVTAHPNNAEAWRLLGTVHAENDDDQQVCVHARSAGCWAYKVPCYAMHLVAMCGMLHVNTNGTHGIAAQCIAVQCVQLLVAVVYTQLLNPCFSTQLQHVRKLLDGCLLIINNQQLPHVCVAFTGHRCHAAGTEC
jgi:hypothetical protein